MSKQDRSELVREWADDLNFAVAKELWNFPHKYGGSNFSDIRDDEGNYYVDLVLGGGGMLGMAHAGFIHALEESDLRIRAVAGSSAGALSAALLMGIDPKEEWKGILLGALLGALEGAELLDTVTSRIWFLCKFKFKFKGIAMWIPNAMAAFRYQFWHGMIRGDAYEERLIETLETLGEREEDPKSVVGRIISPPALNVRHETGEDSIEDLDKMRLKIVAANITQEEKVDYPDDEDEFIEDKVKFDTDIKSIARWVRASSSVPIFFEPVQMKKKGPTDKVDCQSLDVDIVDGGLMSNFPISAFHRGKEKKRKKEKDSKANPEEPVKEKDPKADSEEPVDAFYLPPRMPTFGVQLLYTKNRPNKTDGPWRLFKALISSMVDVGDKEFIETNPDYRLVVTKIDVTEIEPFKSSDSALEAFNLYLKKKVKISLFVLGYVKGKEFLQGFDWYGYKNLRRDMATGREKNGENDK